jgi:hypothetical protein
MARLLPPLYSGCKIGFDRAATSGISLATTLNNNPLMKEAAN